MCPCCFRSVLSIVHLQVTTRRVISGSPPVVAAAAFTTKPYRSAAGEEEVTETGDRRVEPRQAAPRIPVWPCRPRHPPPPVLLPSLLRRLGRRAAQRPPRPPQRCPQVPQFPVLQSLRLTPSRLNSHQQVRVDNRKNDQHAIVHSTTSSFQMEVLKQLWLNFSPIQGFHALDFLDNLLIEHCFCYSISKQQVTSHVFRSLSRSINRARRSNSHIRRRCSTNLTATEVSAAAQGLR